jgi:hypothetical protein
MAAAVGEDLTRGVDVFVEEHHAVRELENLKRIRHVGDARHARQVALGLGISRHPVLVVLPLLLQRPGLIRNLVSLYDALTRRHTETGWESREPLA